MNRNTISTGKRHQAEVATWVRRRLVDSRAGQFNTGRSMIDQCGVVLADGVGLGKTWEALAASALILVESGKKRRDGSLRQNLRKQPARVLVLCPPGLVSKWTREIRDPEGFRAHLERWAKASPRRAFVLETLTEPYEIRRRSDLAFLDAGRIRRSQVELPVGTYVCNWNVLRKKIGSGRSRLAALRAQQWDVLIVDEAHHREAREVIEAVESWSRGIQATLLLTATPFQLDPRELHQLFGTILDHRHGGNRVLSRPPVRGFIEALSGFFKGAEAPSAGLKRQVEFTLGQVIVRSNVPSRGRRYYLINEEGRAVKIEAPDRMREDELGRLMESLLPPDNLFQSWYLRRRLQLADGERTFVPTKLRQALSTPGQARLAGGTKGFPVSGSPRLNALATWARSQIETDLKATARDGYPRKVLVFTSFVEKAAKELQESLADAVNDAWAVVKGQEEWRRMADAAVSGIRQVARRIEHVVNEDEFLARSQVALQLVEAVQSLAEGSQESLFKDLFGHRHFWELVLTDLTHHLQSLSDVLRADKEAGGWARLHRDERKGIQATIRAPGRTPIVGTYTGHDDRRDRDAIGEAFRSPLAPWVLVASNVGSEGIDLHSFSSHLVHFDIEWNPAKMEQREGRTDRLGRILPEPVNIYYVLVRKTYDEKMLQQLVARQRWHSVLLGKPAARLARDEGGNIEARFLRAEAARKSTLNLSPRNRKS